MNRRELLKSGVVGLLPIILGRPAPKLERVGQQLVLPEPASIVPANELVKRLGPEVVHVTIAHRNGAIIFDGIAAEADIRTTQPYENFLGENGQCFELSGPYGMEATLRFVATGRPTWEEVV